MNYSTWNIRINEINKQNPKIPANSEPAKPTIYSLSNTFKSVSLKKHLNLGEYPFIPELQEIVS